MVFKRRKRSYFGEGGRKSSPGVQALRVHLIPFRVFAQQVPVPDVVSVKSLFPVNSCTHVLMLALPAPEASQQEAV